MDSRPDDGDVPSRGARSVVWAVIAVMLLAGIVVALIYGPRLVPVLDTLP